MATVTWAVSASPVQRFPKRPETLKVSAFNAYCATLPATTKVVQWGGSHVWKVGGKVFALASPWGEARPDNSFKIGFKCSDLAFQILTEQPGIRPSPYLGRYKWVQLQENDALSEEDTKAYIEAAHALISQKLTRALRRELGLLD